LSYDKFENRHPTVGLVSNMPLVKAINNLKKIDLLNMFTESTGFKLEVNDIFKTKMFCLVRLLRVFWSSFIKLTLKICFEGQGQLLKLKSLYIASGPILQNISKSRKKTGLAETSFKIAVSCLWINKTCWNQIEKNIRIYKVVKTKIVKIQVVECKMQNVKKCKNYVGKNGRGKF
jgi:hypothetical protein